MVQGCASLGFYTRRAFEPRAYFAKFKGKLTSFLELFALVAFPWSRGPLRVRCS